MMNDSLENIGGIRLFGEFVKKIPAGANVRVAVGIITYPLVCLLVQKKYKALYFPGGTLESGESIIECLKREVREELGENVEIVKLSKSYIETWVYSPKKNSYVRVLSYVGKIKINGELRIRPDEIEKIIFVPYEQINREYLRNLGKLYYIGPSVVDAFILKREKLYELINEVEA